MKLNNYNNIINTVGCNEIKTTCCNKSDILKHSIPLDYLDYDAINYIDTRPLQDKSVGVPKLGDDVFAFLSQNYVSIKKMQLTDYQKLDPKLDNVIYYCTDKDSLVGVYMGNYRIFGNLQFPYTLPFILK